MSLDNEVKSAETVVKDWYVYMLISQKDQSIYTGITTDLNRRVNQHNSGSGARHTRSRRPYRLLGYVTIGECPAFVESPQSRALKLEAKVKTLTHQEKLELALSRLWQGPLVELVNKNLVLGT